MTRSYRPSQPNYLLPSQVAEIMHVSPKTISRWSVEGKLPFTRTLGGHRRFREDEIRALVATNTIPVETRR
jgi:excisionase family DNA binding protein